jgi:hypothetical protein
MFQRPKSHLHGMACNNEICGVLRHLAANLIISIIPDGWKINLCLLKGFQGTLPFSLVFVFFTIS